MQIWEVGYKYKPDIDISESKIYSDADEAFKALNFIRNRVGSLPDSVDYEYFVKVSEINEKFNEKFNENQWLFDLIPGTEVI
jgi:hypothetical protein